MVTKHQHVDVLVTLEIPLTCSIYNTFTLHLGSYTLVYNPSVSPTTARKHQSCLRYLFAEKKDDKTKSRDLAVSQICAAHTGLYQLWENTSQPWADRSNSQLVPEPLPTLRYTLQEFQTLSGSLGQTRYSEGQRVNYPFWVSSEKALLMASILPKIRFGKLAV